MVKASVTRASHKRRLHDNKLNYSAKKAKVEMMKMLVVEYNKVKSLNNVNNTCCTLQGFYDEKKILFPWLKKETLRWHVRNPKTSKTTTDTTTEAKHNLKSFVIQQSQVRT